MSYKRTIGALGIMLRRNNAAFTLIEVLLAVAIIGTLVALLVPTVSSILDRMRITEARAEIGVLGAKIQAHQTDSGDFPAAIEEIELVDHIDPWGNPYQYLIILGKEKSEIAGKWRKDRFLVPINSDFDLYSMGKDGKSSPPLTAQASHDDIVRANNGTYIGLASKY
jgi:general secretion pathway protein G